MGRRGGVRILAVVAAGVLGVGAAWAVTAPIIKSSKNASLGPIVVNAAGLTLYHASSERNGKITCSGNCVYFWFPVIWTKLKVRARMGPVLYRAGSVAQPASARTPAERTDRRRTGTLDAMVRSCLIVGLRCFPKTIVGTTAYPACLRQAIGLWSYEATGRLE